MAVNFSSVRLPPKLLSSEQLSVCYKSDHKLLYLFSGIFINARIYAKFANCNSTNANVEKHVDKS